MIRFLIVATFVILFLILSIPVFLIEWIIGKFNPRARDISALRIVQGAFKIVAFLSGVKLTVIGEEHVPKDQAVLYIGNHRSFFDIVLTYARCPDLTGYIAQKGDSACAAALPVDEISLLPVSGSYRLKSRSEDHPDRH